MLSGGFWHPASVSSPDLTLLVLTWGHSQLRGLSFLWPVLRTSFPAVFVGCGGPWKGDVYRPPDVSGTGGMAKWKAVHLGNEANYLSF